LFGTSFSAFKENWAVRMPRAIICEILATRKMHWFKEKCGLVQSWGVGRIPGYKPCFELKNN
jgi:hypothetical protein